MAIENAGFHIKDIITHHFGTGFPKSTNISKQLDKKAGVERIKGRVKTDGRGTSPQKLNNHDKGNTGIGHADGSKQTYQETLPTSPEAKIWDGYATALKPATEHWILCMKPNEGSSADNALEFGVAGLNIDESRISLGGDYKCKANGRPSLTGLNDNYNPENANQHDIQGRYPANLILSHHPECELVGMKKIKVPRHRDGYQIEKENFGGTRSKIPLEKNDHSNPDATEKVEKWNCHPDCPIRILDEQSGELKSGGVVKGTEPSRTGQNGIYNIYNRIANKPFIDQGGASRFFKNLPADTNRFLYCGKASQKERNAGCEDLEEKKVLWSSEEKSPGTFQSPNTNRSKKNHHPTVKSLKLMEYLLTLLKTPTGGICIDPFCGSGSTLVACQKLNIECIGMEIDKDYCEITKKRLQHKSSQKTLSFKWG